LSRARELLPLLSSIGREIEERTKLLEALDARIEQLTSRTPSKDVTLRLLVAEAAMQRRELRLARAELERLGCRVVGTDPVTIRIPGRIGSINKSFVWRTTDPALR
jgi:hypothetical protein